MAASILIVDQLPKGGAIGANIGPRKIEAKLRSEPAQARRIFVDQRMFDGMSTVNV